MSTLSFGTKGMVHCEESVCWKTTAVLDFGMKPIIKKKKFEPRSLYFFGLNLCLGTVQEGHYMKRQREEKEKEEEEESGDKILFDIS